MGTIRAICTSAEKGTAKRETGRGELIEQHGLKGDAHAGGGHRQVSLLSLEKIEAFRAKGAEVEYGDFGENIIAEGIDFAALSTGTKLHCGEALLQITQIGKECIERCAIYHRMGDCIMPREGIFAIVLKGGMIQTGDAIYAE
jgi:TatD DNase family protein